MKNFVGDDNVVDVIKKLYSLNAEAVNYRYEKNHPKTIPSKTLNTICVFEKVSLYQFLKSLHCLHYQILEGEVPKTKTYKRLSKLIDGLESYIISSLSQYKKAVWD